MEMYVIPKWEWLSTGFFFWGGGSFFLHDSLGILLLSIVQEISVAFN